jgi:hypothetical protein
MNLEKLKQQLLDLQKQLYKKPRTLYEVAKQSEGIDVTPDDLIPDPVACAITVSTIIRKLIPDFPLVAGTYTLFDVLEHHPRFRRVTLPMPGTIIISPTSMSRKRTTIKNGHCGIFTLNHNIMSNNSNSNKKGEAGTFVENYTLIKWKEYFEMRGGYPIFFYALE